jgi:hypothetical protein
LVEVACQVVVDHKQEHHFQEEEAFRDGEEAAFQDEEEQEVLSPSVQEEVVP